MSDQIQLVVSIGDKTNTLIVPASSTLDFVMKEISRKYIPAVEPQDLELVHAGKMLSYNSGKTLKDLDITHMSSLTIVMGLKGGTNSTLFHDFGSVKDIRQLQVVVSIGDKKYTLFATKLTTMKKVIEDVQAKLLPRVDPKDIDVVYAGESYSLESPNATANLGQLGIANCPILVVYIRMVGEQFRNRPRVRFSYESNVYDMITCENDPSAPRAIMPCGHAITSESMIEYCNAEVSQKKDKITCPSCRAPWDWPLIEEVAQFRDDNVKARIQNALSENYLMKTKGFFPCPGCKIWCLQTDKSTTIVRCAFCSKQRSYEFCCNCFTPTNGTTTKCKSKSCDGSEEKLKILKACLMKTIGKVDCPSRRVCPRCGLLIEHLVQCQHIVCKGCKYEFCFICLNKWDNNSHLNVACPLAPRQTAIPSNSS